MDVADEARLGKGQQIVIAAQLARPVAESGAAIIFFGEPRALDHRAHGAVKQQDSLGQQRFEVHGMRRQRKLQTKGPFSFRQKRASSTVSLAEFVTRPQAEHQIGAEVGVCPQGQDVSIARL